MMMGVMAGGGVRVVVVVVVVEVAEGVVARIVGGHGAESRPAKPERVLWATRHDRVIHTSMHSIIVIVGKAASSPTDCSSPRQPRSGRLHLSLGCATPQIWPRTCPGRE